MKMHLTIILFFLTHQIGFNQNSLSYLNAPNENYFDIQVPTYDGLPLLRLGGSSADQVHYELLIEMSLMQEYYKAFQVKQPTYGIKYRSNYVESPNSAAAQVHLVYTLAAILNVKGYNEYFINPDKPSKDYGRKRTIRNGAYATWGGSRADEFDARSSFSKFIKQDYGLIIEWANSI